METLFELTHRTLTLQSGLRPIFRGGVPWAFKAPVLKEQIWQHTSQQFAQMCAQLDGSMSQAVAPQSAQLLLLARPVELTLISQYSVPSQAGLSCEVTQTH